MKDQKTSVSAIVALVFAILALLLSAVPIINNFAFVLAVLGIAFGVYGLMRIKKGKRSGNKIAISSIIISIVAFVIVLASQAMYGAALDEASKAVDESVSEATGGNTDDVLKNSVDVKLGKYSAKADQYGIMSTELPVTVSNKLDEKKSYTIHVEAVDKDGKRIADDYVYANDLGPKQTQEFKVFQYVEEAKQEAMKSADFKIVSASKV